MVASIRSTVQDAIILNRKDITMEDKEDGFDSAWHSCLLFFGGLIFLIPSLFGWCWLLTWFTNFRGYRGLAASAGAGDWTPYIAGAIAILPLMAFMWMKNSLEG